MEGIRGVKSTQRKTEQNSRPFPPSEDVRPSTPAPGWPARRMACNFLEARGQTTLYSFPFTAIYSAHVRPFLSFCCFFLLLCFSRQGFTMCSLGWPGTLYFWLARTQRSASARIKTAPPCRATHSFLTSALGEEGKWQKSSSARPPPQTASQKICLQPFPISSEAALTGSVLYSKAS